MPCSSRVTSALEENFWIDRVDPMNLKDDESAVDLEVWVENCLDCLLLLSGGVPPGAELLPPCPAPPYPVPPPEPAPPPDHDPPCGPPGLPLL